MKYRKFNEEVLYADEAIPKLDKAGLEFLKKEVLKNPRKRIRLCTHRGINDSVHEMFILHTRDAYVRPHKHLNKPESLLVIEGEADIVFFNDEGVVTEKIRMSHPASGEMFYYRIDDPVFHTLIIRSEMFCFKEVAAGPFHKEDTIFAAWAPEETDLAGIGRFLESLKKRSVK